MMHFSASLCEVLADERRTLKYMLEMARTYSIEMSGSPVLCRRFLPWMDLTVSACERRDVWDPVSPWLEFIEKRFHEILEMVADTEDEFRVRKEWRRETASFGVVMWWPLEMRRRAFEAMGPFKVVIDCEHTGVQVHHEPLLRHSLVQKFQGKPDFSHRRDVLMSLADD